MQEEYSSFVPPQRTFPYRLLFILPFLSNIFLAGDQHPEKQMVIPGHGPLVTQGLYYIFRSWFENLIATLNSINEFQK
jgi:hypothetical protein